MLHTTVTGNLGNDPDLRYSASGTAFLRFNVASSGRVRNADGGWTEETTWVRVTVLGQRGETLAQHLHKGQRVCVVGRLEARPWTDQAGNLRAGLEITANEVDFMSPREQGGQPQQNRHPQQQPAGRGPQRMENGELEDLPF